MLQSSATPADSGLAYLRIADILRNQWNFIVGAMLVGMILAGLISLLLASLIPRYQSTTSVVLTGLKYKVSFDPKITTVDSLSEAGDSLDRSEEFKAIAQSPEVFQMTADTLDEKIDDNNLPFDRPKVLAKGGLITIEVSENSPARARQVASAYAQAVTVRLNDVYNRTSTDRAALEQQRSEAQATYERTEAALSAYIRQNRLDALKREIDIKETFRRGLAGLTKKQNSVVVEQLLAYYQALAEIDRLERDTKSLQQQIQTATSSSASMVANVSAMMAVQTRLTALGSPSAAGESQVSVDKEGKTVFSSAGGVGPSIPIQLQLDADRLLDGSVSADLGNINRQQMLNDIDAVLLGIELRRQDFLRAAETTTEKINQGIATTMGSEVSQTRVENTVDALTREVQVLQSELHEEELRNTVLNYNVETSKTYLYTLNTKLQESQIASMIAGSSASIASTASFPNERNFPPAHLRSILYGGLAGLAIGLLWALLRELAKQRPQWLIPFGLQP